VGNRLVYSTDSGARPEGKPCKRCGQWPCRCEPEQSRAPGDQPVRVARERSGRRGKTVTVIAPLYLVREDAAALLKTLKRMCGSGGTFKAVSDDRDAPCFQLEIQGDHVESLLDRLGALGYKPRRSGG